MKKLLIFLVLASACSIQLSAWGRLGHATINKIAEDHLTKTTRERVKEIMHGESIVTYASLPDDARDRFNRDFVPDWKKDAKGFSHTYEVDENLQAYRGTDDGGRYVTNAIFFIDGFANDLANAENRPDSANFIELAMLCHFIGDMHCPGHVRYQPKRDIANKVWMNWNGEKKNYHTIWDNDAVTFIYPWSWSDLAALCDICSKKQIAEIVKGDYYDWAHDCAVVSKPCRDCYRKGRTYDLDREWFMDHASLVRSQIRNAGYRLAHELNLLFDPRYARKYRKQ